MFQISARLGRTEDLQITLFKADGVTPAIVQTNDVVRIKVFRGSSAPVLDLSSDGATTNGSSVVGVALPNNVVNLRLAQGDTSTILPGSYRMEIDIIDVNDVNDGAGPPNPIKPCDSGVLDLLTSGGGNIGT